MEHEPTDAEIADCVRWMMRERMAFDISGGIEPARDPVCLTPRDFVAAVTAFRAKSMKAMNQQGGSDACTQTQEG